MSEVSSNIEKYFDNKISNLEINTKKMLEVSKCNTKIVMNSLGCGMIVLGVAHIALTFLSPLLIIPGGYVISRSIKNAKERHKSLIEERKKLKK